jgi:uncharacterized membrane protein
MHDAPVLLVALEKLVGQGLHVVGNGIEVFGVFVIVAGIGWSTYLYLQRRTSERVYEAYKIRVGRSLLLGLEVLMAADIVKTIALELTFTSLGVLAGLVVVRTFLSWTLVLEIEGRWPWQRQASRPASGVGLGMVAGRFAGKSPEVTG